MCKINRGIFSMKIENLKVKNFRAFKNAEMSNIPRFSVIVGSNGTGKSTLFQVFGFLKDAMTDNVQVALQKLGGPKGFHEVRSRNSEGPIEIELRFRETDQSKIITYLLKINEKEGKVIVEHELLKYRRGSRGKPWHFLEFNEGQGTAVTNELTEIKHENDLKRQPQSLKSPDILAIKGLSQFKEFPAVKALGDLIENWHISDFHISQARNESQYSYAEHLSREGENLAHVARFLHDQHPNVFKAILKKLEQCIPGIVKVESEITSDGRVLLRFSDGSFKDPFNIKYVSDGTVKMFAYLVLLNDPNPHPLLCVEEPENQLYRTLLIELAEEFRAYANRGEQVFVSTHSVDFLNAVNPEEIFWLVKNNGYTEIKRAKDDKQICALAKAGDKMGYLWRQGFFGEIDPK